MKNADSILIMGSNMAECHPVAFRWVMQARTRSPNPCKVIHADPRFTRTSAMVNLHAPLRAGTDIVFLGALIKRALDLHERILTGAETQRTERDRAFFRDYFVHYTNAATLINEDFEDTEVRRGIDPEAETLAAGRFSGYDPVTRRYNPATWRYDAAPPPPRPQPGGGQSFSELI